MQLQYNILNGLREDMNDAWERKRSLQQELDTTWSQVESLQLQNGGRIDSLKDEHDLAFEEMKAAFAEASDAFEHHDHDRAACCSARGKELGAQLPGFVNERRQLIDELQSARAEHRDVLDKYRQAKSEFELAQEHFGDQKAVIEAAKKDAVIAAGIAHYRHEVKVVHESGGATSIYFGGVGTPDGEGHAHYVVDATGRISYRRDVNQPHGRQNVR